MDEYNDSREPRGIPTQEQGTLGKALTGMAFTMVSYALFHQVSVGTLKGAERGIMSLLRNANPERLSKGATALRKVLTETKGEKGLWDLVQSKDVLNSGGRLASVGKFVKGWDDAGAAAREMYAKYKGKGKRVDMFRALKRMDGGQRYDILKSMGAEYAKELAVTAPIFYAGEKTIGIMHHDSQERQRKEKHPWWNLPAHAMDFAKWLPQFALMDVGFRAAQFAMPAVRQTLKQKTTGMLADSWMSESSGALFDYARTASKKMGGLYHRINDAYTYAYRETGGESGHGGLFLIKDSDKLSRYRINKDPVGTMVQRARLFQDAYKKRLKVKRKPLPQSMVHSQFIGDVNKHSSSGLYRILKSIAPDYQKFGKSLENALMRAGSQSSRHRMLPRLLGLIPSRMKHVKEADRDLYDRLLSDTVSITRKYRREFPAKDVKGDPAHLYKSIKKVIWGGSSAKKGFEQKLYHEDIFYDPYRKSLVDLRDMTPGDIIRGALRNARRAFSFGRKFDTLGIFQLHLAEHKAPRVAVLQGDQIVDPALYLKRETGKRLGALLKFKGLQDMGSATVRGKGELPGFGVVIQKPGTRGRSLFIMQDGNYQEVTRPSIGLIPEHSKGKLHKVLIQRFKQYQDGGIVHNPEVIDKIKDGPYKKARQWLWDKLGLFGADGENLSAFEYAKAYLGPLNIRNLFNKHSLLEREGYDIKKYLEDDDLFKDLKDHFTAVDAALHSVNKKSNIFLKSKVFSKLFSKLKDDPDDLFLEELHGVGVEDVLQDSTKALKMMETLFAKGEDTVLKNTPDFPGVQQLISQLSGGKSSELYNPIGEPFADRFRRFMINYRLTSLARHNEGAELSLAEGTNSLARSVIDEVSGIIGSAATQRDRAFVEMTILGSRFRKLTGGDSISKVTEKKDALDTFENLLGLLESAKDQGTLQRFSKEVGFFTKYKIPDPYREDIYGMVTRAQGDPYMIVNKDPLSVGKLAGYYAYDTMATAMDFMGMGFNRSRYRDFLPKMKDGSLSWENSMLGMMGKRMAFASATMASYQAVDTFLDVNPMFDNTMFDEGLTVAAADQAANARLLAGKVFDITGITSAAQYMEGLMPKSTSILPGAVTGFMMGGLPGMLAGGVINRYTQSQLEGTPFSALALLPPLAPFTADLTKGYDELKAIYSGEQGVPYRKGAGWTVGTTPIEGGRIKAFVPNWYARLKSQYKATPALYGSKVEEFIFKDLPFLDFSFGDIIAPQYLQNKHREDRPYVMPDVPFSEVPIAGPVLGATVGRLYNLLHPFASNEPMHVATARDLISGGITDSQEKTWGYGGIYSGSPAIGIEGGNQFGTLVPGTTEPYHGEIASPYEARALMAEQVYRGFIEPAGLTGFATSALLWDQDEPFHDDQPIFASADEIDSFRRTYWDQNLGDLFLLNEGFRRLFPRPRTDYEKVNPIPNKMPGWMPDDFKHGDPYCLTPDTLVEVNGGLSLANEVKPGDLIRTVRGRLFPVKRVAVRDIDEIIYNVRIKGLPFNIKASEEHPFYIDGEWIQVQNLKSGQYVAYPLLSIKPDPVIYMRKEKAQGTWAVPPVLPITGKIARLTGLLLKDDVRPNSQNFVLSGPNREEISYLLKDIFDVKSSIGGRYKNKALVEYINRLRNEGLPFGFYGAELSIFIQFLQLFAEFDTKTQHIYFNLPNESLAYQVWSILIEHGLVGRLQGSRLEYVHRHGRDLALLCGYDPHGMSVEPDKNWNRFEQNAGHTRVGFIRLEIEEVTQEHYCGPVYGYEVDLDDSFCVPGAITHNTKVPFGELMLPGTGYEAVHAVDLTFPSGPSSLGKSAYEQALQMIGLSDPMSERTEEILEEGTRTHRIVQEMLTRMNDNVRTEAMVYDPYNNIKGYIDVLIGDTPVEIKTTGGRQFQKLKYPKFEHQTQLNTYLKLLNERKGQILYVNRDDPAQIKTFNVNYDPELYQQTMSRLDAARELATQYLQEGYGSSAGGYSYLDRAQVLLGAAPFSKEFKDTWEIVKAQSGEGLLTPHQQQMFEQLQTQRKAMMFKYELYPRRFQFTDLITPDTQYNNYSTNEHIKAAAEYSLPERMMGSVWESFTHLRSPLHSKFFGLYSPEEQYERSVLYGRDYKSWAKPWDHWVEPYGRGLRSVTNPVQGGISYGVGGLVMGGPILASVTAPLGMIYGVGHGLYRKITGTKYIPDRFEDMSDMSEYFDRAKYYQAHMNYLATRDYEYAKEMQRTSIGWTLNALADEGMRQHKRKSHNPAQMGYGDDLGFGSPWKGLKNSIRRSFNKIVYPKLKTDDFSHILLDQLDAIERSQNVIKRSTTHLQKKLKELENLPLPVTQAHVSNQTTGSVNLKKTTLVHRSPTKVDDVILPGGRDLHGTHGVYAASAEYTGYGEHVHKVEALWNYNTKGVGLDTTNASTLGQALKFNPATQGFVGTGGLYIRGANMSEAKKVIVSIDPRQKFQHPALEDIDRIQRLLIKRGEKLSQQRSELIQILDAAGYRKASLAAKKPALGDVNYTPGKRLRLGEEDTPQLIHRKLKKVVNEKGDILYQDPKKDVLFPSTSSGKTDAKRIDDLYAGGIDVGYGASAEVWAAKDAYFKKWDAYTQHVINDKRKQLSNQLALSNDISQDNLFDFMQHFEKTTGNRIFIKGGSARDRFLGRKPSTDIDLVVIPVKDKTVEDAAISAHKLLEERKVAVDIGFEHSVDDFFHSTDLTINQLLVDASGDITISKQALADYKSKSLRMTEFQRRSHDIEKQTFRINKFQNKPEFSGWNVIHQPQDISMAERAAYLASHTQTSAEFAAVHGLTPEARLKSKQAVHFSRREHNPAAQWLGPDKGFGSPWQGMDPNKTPVEVLDVRNQALPGINAMNTDPFMEEEYGKKMGRAISGLPYWDKPYLFPFMAANPDDRENILKMVDAQMRMVLQTAWQQGSEIPKSTLNLNQYFEEHPLPSMMDPLMNPAVPMEDVQMKTVENAGFDAHDFGLGWQQQESRLRNSPHQLDPININGDPLNTPSGDSVDSGSIREQITSALASFGITNAPIMVRTAPDPFGGSIKLNIRIERDRSMAEHINELALMEN